MPLPSVRKGLILGFSLILCIVIAATFRFGTAAQTETDIEKKVIVDSPNSPQAVSITGQLWYGIINSPPIVGHVNSDSSSPGHTGDEAGPGEIEPDTIALDLAAGLYFQTNATDFNASPPLSISCYRASDSVLLSSVEIGSVAQVDQVNALTVDPLNHFVYVGRWGVDFAHSGIVKVSYNPATGILDPTAASTGSPVFITHSTAVDNDFRAFSLDLAGQKLYYSVNNNGYNIAPYSPSNGIYVVGTAGGSPTQLTVTGNGAGQFPLSTTTLSIGPIVVDVSKGLVYFETSNFSNGLATLWYMPVTGGTANQVTNVPTLAYGDAFQGGLSLDPQTQQLYIATNANAVGAGATEPIQVLQLQLSGDGHSITSTVHTYPFLTLYGAAAQPGSNIVGTAFDQLPVLTVSGNLSHATEQGAAINLLSANPSIADPDNGYLSNALLANGGAATITIAGGFAGDGDSLSVSAAGLAGTSITANAFNTATHTLTLTGYDTIAHYQQALGGVQFTTTGDNPTNYGSNITRTITWQVNDGAIGNLVGANQTTSSITIDAVDDAPVNAVPGTQTINENTSRVFSSGNSNQISISDLDSTTSSVSLNTTNGITTLSGTSGLAFSSGANGTAAMTFSGTIANINTAMNGMTFVPTTNFFGGASVQIITNDQSSTGSGGPLTDTDTVNITVNLVNHVPSFTKGADQTVLAASGAKTVNGWATSLSAGPASESGQALNFIVSNNNAGIFAVVPAVDSSGNLTFTPSTTTFGSATVSVQIHDNGGVSNGGVDTSAVQTFSITVSNTDTWTGATSSDWNTASNWNFGVVPAASNDVSLPTAGVTNQPTIPTGNLTVNNITVASGRTLGVSGGNLTVNGTLTMSGGDITVSSGSTLSIGASGGVTRTTGVIIGDLKKTFAGAGSFTYPVGTAGAPSVFSPVDVTVTVGSGDLTISAHTGTAPATPVLDPTKTLQRFWTLNGSGITANVKWHYLVADVAGNESLYSTIRVSGTTATPMGNGAPCPGVGSPCVDSTAHTIFVSGLSSFSNWLAGILVPTAAGVGVSGRVLTSDGRGISQARVTMTDKSGKAVSVVTNSFGYYSFTDISAGQGYVIGVDSKRYRFSSQIVNVSDNIADMNFVAEP